MNLHKFDELDCLICGIEYIEGNNMSNECYYFTNPRNNAMCNKVTYDFSNPYPFLVSFVTYFCHDLKIFIFFILEFIINQVSYLS